MAGALNDDGIGPALRAMHADLGHRWTLSELASVSSMSRSGFAAAFKAQVGVAPMSYLIEWRMSLARDALRRDSQSISELAYATGYESESAFSTAFRRVVGMSPRKFRDSAKAASRCDVAQKEGAARKPASVLDTNRGARLGPRPARVRPTVATSRPSS